VDRAVLQSLSKLVIDAAFAVRTQLGPGLLESSYTACMKFELEKQGLRVEAEVPVPLVYDGQKLNDVGRRTQRTPWHRELPTRFSLAPLA